MRKGFNCLTCGDNIKCLLDEAMWEESKYFMCECGSIFAYSTGSPKSSVPCGNWFRKGNIEYATVWKNWKQQELKKGGNMNKLEYRYSVIKPLMDEHGITLEDVVSFGKRYKGARDSTGVFIHKTREKLTWGAFNYSTRVIEGEERRGTADGVLLVNQVEKEIWAISEFITDKHIATFRIDGDQVTMINESEQGEPKMNELTTKIEAVKSEIESIERQLADAQERANVCRSKLDYIKANPEEAKLLETGVHYKLKVADEQMHVGVKKSFKGDIRVLQLIFEAELQPHLRFVSCFEAELKALNTQKDKLEAAAKLAEEALQ